MASETPPLPHTRAHAPLVGTVVACIRCCKHGGELHVYASCVCVYMDMRVCTMCMCVYEHTTDSKRVAKLSASDNLLALAYDIPY